jgi:hypothetical protein
MNSQTETDSPALNEDGCGLKRPRIGERFSSFQADMDIIYVPGEASAAQ